MHPVGLSSICLTVQNGFHVINTKTPPLGVGQTVLSSLQLASAKGPTRKEMCSVGELENFLRDIIRLLPAWAVQTPSLGGE